MGVDVKVTGRNRKWYEHYKKGNEEGKLYYDLSDLELLMGKKCLGKVHYCRVFPPLGEKGDWKDPWHLDCSIESIQKDEAIQCADMVFNDWTPWRREKAKWVHIICGDRHPQDSASFAKGLESFQVL